MIVAPLAENEIERLSVLHQCHILDTLPESDYEGLVFLAAQICQAPIALISLVDAERQWFKARFGIDAAATPRSDAFCSHAILHPDEVMIVPDASKDPRFEDNPLVRGNPNIRFYAGAPIVVVPPKDLLAEEGVEPPAVPLGTVCVISDTPRELTPAQEKALRALARQVGNLLDLRLRRRLDEETNRRLQRQAERLRESEHRLNIAQEMAKIGSWEYDIPTGRITWSRETFRLLEIDPTDGEPDYEANLNRYHPEDRVLLNDAVQRAIADGTPYALDLRILRRDGGIRWTFGVGNTFHDETGKVVKLQGTVQDISDRKAAENSLRAMASDLQRSNQALNEFTSVASHDLKEPLRKIQTFGQMLKTSLARADSPVPERALDYANRMSDAARRMQGLIDGLLDLARVSQQSSHRRHTLVDLCQTAQEVISDLEGRLQETDGVVSINALPTVWADPLQMRQLLQNLIGNALKYHRRGTPPVVELKCLPPPTSSCVRIAVCDNGMGFRMEDANRIFEPFERLERDGIEGTGVGLAICKRIVEAHGGSIVAESEIGAGTTFLITLPAMEYPGYSI